MNRLNVIVAFALCVLFVVSARTASAQIQVNTSDHNHRFEYWGSSLAWWGNEVGGQSNVQGREEIVDLFFDANNGLGMNFLRYNIGAGSNPDTSIQNITRPGAKMDGWVPSKPSDILDPSTWVWDWNADATQRLVLDMAIDHGVNNVEAFANSAPWWLTRNEQSNGISGGGSNLTNSRVDEFAHYMFEVIEHFENNLGIKFETLAPMNEPGSGFWDGNSNQEGMGVPVGSFPWQDRLIKTFGETIADRGSDIKLVGLEETSTDQSADSWTNSLITDEAKAFIKQFNTHTYGFNGGSGQSDSERLFDAVTGQDGLKIYATEYGTGTGATRLARQINSDIRYLDAAGWTYWQALEDNNGSGWGLAISNFNGNNPRVDIQDQYFAFKQFSAYIRPGSEIIELDNQEDITAAYDPRTGKTVLVVNNEDAGDTSQNYSFDFVDRGITGTRLIRTTDEDNIFRTDAYLALGPASTSGNNINFDAFGDAVTSIVISHRPNLIQNGNFDPNGLPDNSPQFDDWQAQGDVVFDTGIDINGDGSGSLLLITNSAGNAGKAYQTGIGDADTDLTGVAFQIAADVQFRNNGNNNYDAETFLAVEFYGADDEILTSIVAEDFETEIQPAPSVKANGNESSVNGSDPNDSVYRTFLSGRFVAPEGTRYVRPVVRFEGTGANAVSVVSVDNIELTEVHPEADAREWNVVGSGLWSDADNWLGHARVENNLQAYFGNAINGPSTVSVIGTEVVDGLTFFSEHPYHISGASGGRLEIGNAGSGFNPLIDVRWGNHIVSTEVEVQGDLNLQVLSDSSIRFFNGFDANGFDVRKLGSGIAILSNGFELGGGTLSAYASIDATIILGGSAILDGDFELLVSPGQELGLGDVFEIASYSSLNDTFDSLVLPSLSSDLEWEAVYGSNALTVQIVESALLGDFNGNGIVDAADYTVWRDNFLVPDESSLMGAGDGSGVVDLGDLLLWRDNFGEFRTSSSTNAIPEPAGLGLALIAFGFLLIRSRR